jgi:hypothetical protein
MAVAMDTYAPFDSGAGANTMEDVWRKFMKHARGYRSASRSGVIRDIGDTLEVYDDGTGMQVKVKTGEVWIEGHWGEVTAEKTLPIAAADAAFARKDRVVARANFAANAVELDVLTGTPGGTPSAPAVTQDTTKWEISLSVVDVPALDLSISGQCTDARNYLDQPFVSKLLQSNVVVNNSATATTVTDLTVPVSASRQYAFDAYLVYTAATAADAKFQVNGPSGATARVTALGLDPAAASALGSHDSTAASIATALVLGGAGIATTLGAMVRGRISTSTTAGNLTFGFAQNTANVSDATLLLGSWIMLTPIS